MSKKPLTEEQIRFIDDVAALLMPWGMAQTTARLYGYLLLLETPVSLDRISEVLGASKSSVSVAARLLEKHQMARRHGERGSKRILYGPIDHHTGLLTEHSVLWGAFAKLFHARACAVASGAAAQRLVEMADFYASVREVIEAKIEAWRALPARGFRQGKRIAASGAATKSLSRGGRRAAP
ncbi:MAG TPA: hypothetical protein VMB71_06655 [Acetobacteraceae bacterium]|nr:hypothetical protein [Acetobacteraceae bacterium]